MCVCVCVCVFSFIIPKSVTVKLTVFCFVFSIEQGKSRLHACECVTVQFVHVLNIYSVDIVRFFNTLLDNGPFVDG